MRRAVRHRQPTFFWQGTLILLPVALLAGMGFWSLRKDKALAREEAAQRAEGLARTLGIQLWQKLITPGTSRQFKINSAGELISPAPFQPNPVPQPFDLSELSPDAAHLWRTARQAEAAGNEPDAAMAAYGQFLERNPPRRFAAAGHYALGLLLTKRPNSQEAAKQFELVRDNFPEVCGESGVPLSLLASLKLLQVPGLNPVVERTTLVEEICSNLVCHPTALSPYVLKLLAEGPDATEAKAAALKWQQTWAAQNADRELYAAARPSLAHPGWFWFEDLNLAARDQGEVNWLAIPVSTNAATRTYFCRSETELDQDVVDVLRQTAPSVPKYISLAVQFAGRSSAETHVGDPLASAVPAGATDEQLKVIMGLADPRALFVVQTTRRHWFEGLIGAALLAAFIGLGAAYRAFHRQLRLNEMKSNFVSSVSHELRAPIASVRLMAESLERGKVSERSKQHEYFHFIVQECRRLSSLIENVLDFSRIEQGRKQYEFEPTDISALAEQTVRLMQPYAGESGVQLTFVPPPSSASPPQPEVDGKALQQALVNLLDNAIKFSPQGGSVTVGLEFENHDGSFRRPGSSPPHDEKPRPASAPSLPGAVVLWVEDQGEGIPVSEHEKIFERFYRRGNELRRQTQGVGIGLSIVKHIVEAHGGHVRVRSEPGQGSRFMMELPQARNQN